MACDLPCLEPKIELAIKEEEIPLKHHVRKTFKYTSEQKNLLEEAFTKQVYIIGETRKKLAERSGLSEKQIKAWFQNRRSRIRKRTRKQQELILDWQTFFLQHLKDEEGCPHRLYHFSAMRCPCAAHK